MADNANGARVIAPAPDRGRRGAGSLSARLIWLTISFVFLAEILIFAPSLAAFYRGWLLDRVNAAQIAALALDAAPDAAVTASLRQQLLKNAEVNRVILMRPRSRDLLLEGAAGPSASAPHVIDLRGPIMMMSIYDAFGTLFAPPGRRLLVRAIPRFETGALIEIIVPEAPLKHELAAYAVRMLRMSLIISLFNGSLLYVVLNALFVRPMRRLTAHIEVFRERPEDVTLAITPSGRADEIGRAEHALADMEAQVRAALRQRERLAGLGAAVAKLAHDLRNSLSTASLIAERLADSADERVRQSAPRLERAVSRAAGLAEAAMRYGRADEPEPRLDPVPLAAAFDEAADEAFAGEPQITWLNALPADLMVTADRDHLHRIATNLMRNAAHALAGVGGARIEARLARRTARETVIEVADNGPGLSQPARERLFEPFSSGNGGIGLGLSIARELARALGGDLALVCSGPSGVVFALTLRTAPVLAGARS